MYRRNNTPSLNPVSVITTLRKEAAKIPTQEYIAFADKI
jgi:hypothetical protein